MPAVLELRNLTKRFGGITAVDAINLSVQAGELRAIIGPNGSGKTTLFHLISRILEPTSGQILYRGQDVTTVPQHRLAHIGVGRSFQVTNVFPELTVLENVRVAMQAQAAMLNFWRAEAALSEVRDRAEHLLQELGLESRRAAMAGTLSHGEQRYLEIGIALAGNPQLLLLDEPTAGMSAKESVDAAAFVEKLHGRMTILLVEHDMDMVMRMATRVTVLHQGRILAEDSPEVIAKHERVRDIYLGRA